MEEVVVSPGDDHPVLHSLGLHQGLQPLPVLLPGPDPGQFPVRQTPVKGCDPVHGEDQTWATVAELEGDLAHVDLTRHAGVDVRVDEARHEAAPGQVHLLLVWPRQEVSGLVEVAHIDNPRALRDQTVHILGRVPAHGEDRPIAVYDQHPDTSQ